MLDTELLKAIVLGVIQGITEFLPISSDGHLVVFHKLLENWFGTSPGEQTSQLHFDVVLHIGTLGSIVLIYWRDLVGLLKNPRLCALIIVATIPAGVIGLTLKDLVEQAFNSPLTAGFGFLVTAGLLLLGQRLAHESRGLDALTVRDAIAIGLLQSLAIGPGISRSGSTISAGLMTGLRREACATFSFLIAVPVIGGAALLVIKDILGGAGGVYRTDVLVTGTITSFVVGVAALRVLLKVVARGKLHWFAYYCLIAGAATIAWQLGW